MTSNGASNGANGQNGHALTTEPRDVREVAPAPLAVRELAEACVRYVAKAVGVDLDYTAETLPLLDHYLREAKKSIPTSPLAAVGKPAEEPSQGKDAAPPVIALIAHAAGAYLGEVVRRRHASWWRTEGDDPSAWRIELEGVYLSFSPVQMIVDVLFPRKPAHQTFHRSPSQRVLTPEEESDDSERLELEEEDRAAVGARLAELPPVPEDEFLAPSTRVEVIDIAVEAIRARRLGDGEHESVLGPSDYEG